MHHLGTRVDCRAFSTVPQRFDNCRDCYPRENIAKIRYQADEEGSASELKTQRDGHRAVKLRTRRPAVRICLGAP
jgi:hypothetical protein